MILRSNSSFGRVCFGLFTWMVVGAAAPAAEYYLDPISGDNANLGTRAAPWSSLAAVAASDKAFEAGDVLVLLAGHHGSPILRGVNAGMVFIRPDRGARVTLKCLRIKSGCFWTVDGLEISPETSNVPEKVTLLTIEGGADNVIRNCVLYTVRDTSNWTAQDWNRRACDGIFVEGIRQVVENNHLANLNFALSVVGGASHGVFRGNLIENFSGDGMRGLADDCLFEGNVVKNLFLVNENHPDGFQSWSESETGVGSGVVRRVVLRGNYFLSYDNPKRPYRGPLQGIGCFDGFYEDWVVENNVVFTNAWHGIAFYGARNCRIVNNTVADLDLSDEMSPWIMITAHKNGARSSGNLVRNNLSSSLSIDAGSAVVDHNLNIKDVRRIFSNWAAKDLRLKAGCPAIDAGSSIEAPAFDFTGASRSFPGNTAWDIGAVEFGAAGDLLATGLPRPLEPKLNVPPLPSTPALAQGDPAVREPALSGKPAESAEAGVVDQRFVGSWYGEQVYEEKGMVTQYLVERLPDGRFEIHLRGRRSDYPGRLLDFSMKGNWRVIGSRLRNVLEGFVIHEANISPQFGRLNSRDEYEVVSITEELLVAKSARDGRVFNMKRVAASFVLPELPAPPKQAGKASHSPDKSQLDAYFR